MYVELPADYLSSSTARTFQRPGEVPLRAGVYTERRAHGGAVRDARTIVLLDSDLRRADLRLPPTQRAGLVWEAPRRRK